MVFMIAPPALVLLIVAIGYFLDREQLFAIARSRRRQKIFVPESVLPARASFDLVPTNRTGEELEGAAFCKAVDDLIAYAKKYKPNWIVGVHPGGRLLSAYVADRINLTPKKLLYIRTTVHAAREAVLERVEREPSGRVLVVDDISRTGNTLNVVKAFLLKRQASDWPRLRAIRFAVLLVAVSETEDFDSVFRPNFVSYKTEIPNLRLPWSDLSGNIHHALAEKIQKGDSMSEDVRQTVADYDRLISDDAYALSRAKHYIEYEYQVSRSKQAQTIEKLP